MSDTCRLFPYRTITIMLTCVAAAFGIAVGTGALEVRRVSKPAPSPEREAAKAYVHRDKAAESLLDNQNVLWVYQFAGGLPKCWAEIDSEGHKQTLGPWVSTMHPGFIGEDPVDHPILESVEGYVALFGPTSDEQKYRMVCAVTKVEYPPNTNQEWRTTGFRDPMEVRLPNLLPPRPEGIGVSGGFGSNEGTKPRVIPAGEDAVLTSRGYYTPSGKSCTVRLKLRFLTAKEIAAKQ